MLQPQTTPLATSKTSREELYQPERWSWGNHNNKTKESLRQNKLQEQNCYKDSNDRGTEIVRKSDVVRTMIVRPRQTLQKDELREENYSKDQNCLQNKP